MTEWTVGDIRQEPGGSEYKLMEKSNDGTRLVWEFVESAQG